jgi:MATE family multidrug resistance protein
MIIGHIDSPLTKIYVDAATLSIMFTNMTCFSVGIGLLYGLDTLCSQAYGAKRPMQMGIYMQSSMLVFGILLIPMIWINWSTESFLKWTGQDPQVSAFAGKYSRVTIIGAIPLFIYEMHRKILQAQDITRPLVCCAFLGNVINIVGGYFFTYSTKIGFMGTAYSRAMGNLTMCLLLIPYYMYHPNYQLWWPGWNLEQAKKHMGLFLRLGIPGMLMLMMEWCAFEMMAFLAGILPQNGVLFVSIHAVLSNVAAFVYMFFLGLGVAVNIRIGQALGANQPQKAFLISQLSMWIVFCMAMVLSVFVFLYRFEIPKLLINDLESNQHASNALLVLVPYLLFDGLNCNVQSIFRGIGHQGMAATINAIGFYLIGFTIGTCLAFFFHFQVQGLWLGFESGAAFAVFIGVYFIFFQLNWFTLAKEAQRRTAK